MSVPFSPSSSAPRKRVALWALLALFALFGACSDSDDAPDEGGGTPTASLFRDGCPTPGQAVVRRAQHTGLIMDGPDAVGREGDYIIMNEKAAFVISGPESANTFFAFPGILIDAVALDGCKQAHPDQIEEFAFAVGRLNLGRLSDSVLRAFRGEEFTVINDGSNGQAAHLRITGADATVYVVDGFLIRNAISSGLRGSPSRPLGMKLVVDYILEPGTRALKIVFRLENLNAANLDIFPANVYLMGDTTTTGFFAGAEIPVSSFTAKIAVPWIQSYSKDCAYAFAIDNAVMGALSIAGVNAAFDSSYALRPYRLTPAGTAGAVAEFTSYFGVSGGDANDAVAAFRDQLVMPGDVSPTNSALQGVVTDAATGQGMPDVPVHVQLFDSSKGWVDYDFLRTDAQGRFSGVISDLGLPGNEFRVLPKAPNRPATTAQEFRLPAGGPFSFTVAESGKLSFDITDGDGQTIPAKVLLWEGGRAVRRILPTSKGYEAEVEPGTYEVSITRGYEYIPYQGSVTVTAGHTGQVSATLPRVLDTTGYLSMDGHIHASPSPDSMVSLRDRIASIAAENIEVAICTDHEFVGDWSKLEPSSALPDWVATVGGSEVTSYQTEHVNAYPMPLTDHKIRRGDMVRWYDRDIGQTYADIRARGGQVVALNHPRFGCNYACLVGYDRLTGEATLNDPTALGLPAGSTLWSWDFDAFEYMNGHDGVFIEEGKEQRSGLFEDWMSFLNHGHRISALGVTDAHGIAIGSPFNYIAAPTDKPAEFEDRHLVDAILGGDTLVSAGAFARIKVNNQAGMGDEVTVTGGSAQVWLQIQALPEIDVTNFKVFVNCDEVADIPTTSPDDLIKYEGTITVPVTQDAHLVVLGFGKKILPRGLDRFDPTYVPRFTMNAVYLDADGDGRFTPPGGKECSFNLPEPAPMPAAAPSNLLPCEIGVARCQMCAHGAAHDDH